MTMTARIKAAIRRSPSARRAVEAARHSLGQEARLTSHDERLDHLDRAMADVFAAVQQLQGPELGDLRSRLDAIEEHLPTLLNTIASKNGERRQLQRSIATSQTDMWNRIEMVRRELMYELRYGQRGADPVSVEAKVVAEEKLAAAQAEGLRINLGCGHLPLVGYINVDGRDLPDVDIIAPVDHLPIDVGTVEELYSAHLIEHFPQEQLVRELLPYWTSLLRPGGTFRAVVPDAGAMIQGYVDGVVTYEELREVTFGGQEYEGDFHFTMFTTTSMAELLAASGLDEIVVEDEGRRNGACFEFQIAARKPR